MEKTRPVAGPRLAGLAAIVFAVGFNVPYAFLAMTFDYPEILRQPASVALERFAEGGAGLVLTWHAFALAALLFVPLAVMLAITRKRVSERPALAVGAAITGALAGLAQAMGLWRWVFVVPGLAQAHRDPQATEASKLAAEQTFHLINQYGGVAIGEHLGQLLTALFVVLLGALQWSEGRRINATLGFSTAAAIAIGTNEGVAIAIGNSGEVFAMATIVGFLGLTIWLLATGIGQLRRRQFAQ